MNMREIYIAGQPRREIAVVEDGKLVEYQTDEASASAEGVYLGKVERVVPGMKAAFVDIGQEKNGFLPLEEKNLHPGEKLQAGMHVLVQVKREAAGEKGAFLSRDISLCGEYVLVMPLNRAVGVSARITDAEDRERLRFLAMEAADGRCGVVMRTSSVDAPEESIRGEIDELLAVWEEIARKAPVAHAPSMVYAPRSVLDALLDDYRPRGIHRIHTDDPELAKTLSSVCETVVSPPDVMALMGFETQRDKALQRRVWLKSGGNLVIDPCEAMTVIDVNTAKFTGKGQLEETIIKLNLEACGEIARQVRLRNISGIILIDMIDMEEESSRQQVLEALQEAFSHDRVKTVIHGFTSLGLVEMTRKRSRRPLRDEWTQPCPACKGDGRIKEDIHG